MANVFHKEAEMLLRLQHPGVVTYFGGCFDAQTQNIFNVVEGLKQWHTVVHSKSLSLQKRIQMAIGATKY